MGRNFTIQKALDLAQEEERVDRALLHLSSLQVDAVSSRPIPPLRRCRRLVRVLATAAARRSTGRTPPPALLGAGRARGAECADTSRESAAPLRSRRLVIRAHRR
ncbi:hypothetical protein MTO96_019284 [Rhipicephalus appendiculatus]